MVHLFKATSTVGENRKLFIMVTVYKWKLILSKIQGMLALYRQRTKTEKKNNRINFRMDFSHNPTIHHLELTSI